jgi:hypothetical protein
MTLPINAMRSSSPPPLEPAHIVLVRKVILLGLLMVVAALGLVLILQRIHIYSVILPHILSDAAMGLVAGISSRWVLRRQTTFLRVVSMLAFLVGGLELLGWFTGWQIGFGPLKPGLPGVDWSSLGQLLLATGVSVLTLFAWTQPTSPPIQTPPAPKPANLAPRPRPRLPKRRRPIHARSKLVPAAHPAPVMELVDKPATRHKPQLQLSEEEEHRCPYCLELVDVDDPRGTVECKVCHALHHADCWAITGACQVPHFTA